MRIKLKRGKQKVLISKAKYNKTWRELARELNISKDYLRIDLFNEKIFLDLRIFARLCKLAKVNFSRYIEDKLDDNWGRSKGGLNSRGSTIKLIPPPKNKELAEFIGIVLGDGNISYYKRGKKIGVYQIKIAGDYKKDKDYHLNYVTPLCESLFNLDTKEIIIPKHNERFLVLSSKELVNFFIDQKLYPGNKIENQITIPSWIKNNKDFLKVCIRGLIDTDGSIFRMSKKYPNLIRISFTNKNIRLLRDTKRGLENLGLFVSKIINNKAIFISRKKDIERYIKEIGFSNSKHIERLQRFKNSPVV